MNLREALTVQLQRELDAATVQADTLFGAYLAAKQAVEDAQSRKFRLQDQLRAAQRAEQA